MVKRRTVMFLAVGAAVAGIACALGVAQEARRQAPGAPQGLFAILETTAGALEYAVAGDGPPAMMIHGTGGGFDQGLLFATALRRNGIRIVAPSRFGYLGSSFPDDPSPARQADMLVALLDHLRIDRLTVIGGSAGALSAAEFAVRHPDRCSGLALLVPAANVAGRDPVTFTPLQAAAVNTVLGSDTAFRALSRIAPRRMIRTLLATDPALLETVGPEERRRAAAILDGLQPVSRKRAGLANDAHWAGAPTATPFERIAAPTVLVSCQDDLFGTAATARLLADRIPGAELVMYPSGGHIWLGRDADLAQRLASLVRRVAR